MPTRMRAEHRVSPAAARCRRTAIPAARVVLDGAARARERWRRRCGASAPAVVGRIAERSRAARHADRRRRRAAAISPRRAAGAGARHEAAADRRDRPCRSRQDRAGARAHRHGDRPAAGGEARAASRSRSASPICAAGDAEIDLIDMPGHERFVRTMVSGATGIDARAAGGRRQRGHQAADRRASRHRRACSASRRGDRGDQQGRSRDAARTEAVARRHEAAAAAARSASPRRAPVLCSARDRRRRRSRCVPRCSPRSRGERPIEDRGFPYLPIDRAFSLAGHGTVVTGTLRRGSDRRGRHARTGAGRGPALRVRGLQVHGAQVGARRARPARRGQSARHRGERARHRRGARRARRADADGLAQRHPRRRAWRAAPLRTRRQAQPAVRHRARSRPACACSTATSSEPGETALAQLHCAAPGRGAGARALHPAHALAGGERSRAGGCSIPAHAGCAGITAPRSTASPRSRDGTPDAILARELAASPEGLPLDGLATLVGLAPARTAALLQARPVLILRDGRVLARAAFDDIVARIEQALAASQDGITREALQSAARAPAPCWTKRSPGSPRAR